MTLAAPRPLVFDTLRALSTEQFCSGEALADQLGVSRASISLALQQARELGVPVHSVHGRGYRLSQPVDWLDASQIQAMRQAGAPPLEVLSVTDSTNSQLLSRAAQAVHGLCLTAEFQTAGRGRRGRSWQAALGGSLAFSVLWRFPGGISQLSGLSLAVGVAVVRVLHRLGLQAAQLKWPNDILVDGHKLAGILIETQGDALGPIQAVVGIGLNVRLPDNLQQQIDQRTTDLAAHLPHLPSRNALLALLLDELQAVSAQFVDAGFAAFREEWQHYHVWQGQPVQVCYHDDHCLAGVAMGVDAAGALLLHDGVTVRPVAAGEVSLRAAKDRT
ncbi:biotin--[acetyl-CoA-carboxylase] ligase [Leeia aquatica]|uniref:Bifunctional ligase/repressor BirA n=1 Tax=Leeia aquatica TaxID=2725557 RepID=A0A847SFX7_9NEIS|nr:biotin--[acetyl-CoA-carboxylase] ligase [Leeia aquatica]NLR76326.1 biotin--[acetyl-CoA-carboxylase] ligase [Leeia aquatica]